VRRGADQNYNVMPLTHSDQRLRGTGVADMAYSLLRRKRRHRCSGELAHHVIEVMAAVEKSSVSGRHIRLASTVRRPALLPPQMPLNVLDE
jgi:hypothetical protein